MKLSLLVAIPALFAPIAAQAKSGCLAQFQVDVCIKGADAQIKACGTDPACICQKNKDKGICYINCPDDEKNIGAAKLQDSQIEVLCNVPGAIPTTVKPEDKPTSTSDDDSKATKPSDSAKDKDAGSSKDKDSGSSKNKDTGSSGTSGSSSTPKPGNSGNSQFGSASFVAISMSILASFL